MLGSTINRMSVKLCRWIVTFVMALLLPLQGLAAVSAGLCMGMGMGMEQEVPSNTDCESQALHHGGCCGHAAEGAAPACASCVACGIAVFMCATDSIPLSADLPNAAIPVSPPLFSGIAPERLDRPPLAL